MIAWPRAADGSRGLARGASYHARIMARSAARRLLTHGSAKALVLAALATLATIGCGGATPATRSSDSAARAGVSAENYAELRRAYLELGPDDARRAPTQARLLDYLAARSAPVLEAGNYDAIVGELREMTSLLAPSDFAEGRALPAALGPLARHLAVHGARRGDEARVLAAELILASLEPERRGEHVEAYDRVATWGREARAPSTAEPLAIVRGGMDLASVWEEHARLTPAPPVLARTAELYLALRDALSGARGAEGFRPPRSLEDMRLLEAMMMILQRAQLEAAAVYLARGELAEAGARLASRGEGRGSSGDAPHLRSLIERASLEGEAGADALRRIGMAFSEARPDVSRAVCRLGLRRYPADARFALCLARASVALGVVGDAAAYYERAIVEQGDGADLELIDEALEALRSMIVEGAFARADIGEVRTAGQAAHAIVELRERRFPSAGQAPLDQPTLHVALARAELASGFTDAARAGYREAIAEAPSRGGASSAVIDARRELANLELRGGAPSEARALLAAGLGRVSQGEDGDEVRARITAAIAETERVEGRSEEATRGYREALRLLDGLAPLTASNEVTRERLASRQILRGMVLRRLGDRDGSRGALVEAITLVPSVANARTILERLVVDEPDPALADLVFWRASVGARIEHGEKAALALYVEVVHALAGAPAGEEASRALLAEIAHGGFLGRLASLVRGDVDEASVLAAAESGAERCQAYFYAAIHALREGDPVRARRALEASVATGMLGQREFGMAVELLRAGALEASASDASAAP